jgi:adenylate cyclase
MAGLTEDELAERSGSTAEHVRRFAALGILSAGADGSYRPPDIQRVRIAEALDGAGVSPEQVGELIADGRYSTGWADGLFPDPVPLTAMTVEQAAAELGLPASLITRLFISWALPVPGPEDRLREDDLMLLRTMVLVYRALGNDEGSTVAAARVFGESLRRIAEGQLEIFRTFVERPMIASGMPHHRVMDAAAAMAQPMADQAELAVRLLHRRHLEHYSVEEIVENTEITLERAGVAPRRPVAPPAIAFLDLSGFTRLTEEEGDERAADLATRLADLVQATATRFRGRPVKYLGDGVMFHFPDPAGSVSCGLDLIRDAPAAGLPPARVGINVGSVIFRDGDYFGRTVNIAARVADRAGPGQILVTDDVVIAAKGSAEFREVGPMELKGVAGPVLVHEAVRATEPPAA